MILEALAQTAGILTYNTLGKVPNANTRFYFAGIDGCRFRRRWNPGDQLILTAKVGRNMKGIWKLSTAAYVGEAEAASAEMMLFPDADNAHPARARLMAIDPRRRRRAGCPHRRRCGDRPFTVIGPEVTIGPGCWIGPHAVINGPTRMGAGNRVFQFASIGDVPQDKKYAG